MIWESLVFAVTLMISTLLSFFPVADPEIITKISEQLAPLKTALASANWFFPVSEFTTFLMLVLSIEGIFGLYKFFKFILKNVSFGLLRE